MVVLMVKYLKYVAMLSPWILYLGFFCYHYFTSDSSLLDAFAGFFVGLFAPFFIAPTGVMASILLSFMAIVPFIKWQYKEWLFAVISGLYVFLIYHSIMARLSI